MPTLEEIAQLANVSRSTVSRVVNNNPNVKIETRERVMDVIQRLGFSPNTAARSLAGGDTGVFGLVIPMGVTRIFTEPYFSIFIQSVTQTCNRKNKSVMLWLGEPDYEQRMVNQILYNGLMDGVIVSSMRIDEPIVSAIAESHLPYVLVGRYPDVPNASYIDVDNRACARQMVSYLLSNGHRRVATITGTQNIMASKDRLAGYQQALNESGITVDPELIIEGFFTEEGGYQAMKSLLKKGVTIDAVFAASDVMAIGAMRAIKEEGFDIPDDIAIAGFDDGPMAANTDPPLTTVRQPSEKLGSYAVELLIELLQGTEPAPKRIILPAELIIRQSG
jgi:LacI family transcriptional regulator